MFVSIIVPTYNREEPLCNTIRSILDQKYDNYELLVVDQTLQHSDETVAFLAQHKNKFKLLCIESEGLPHARNEGIAASKGDIIIFCDDDVLLESGWITAHVNGFSDKQIGAIGGRILERGQEKVDVPNPGYINVFGRPVGNFASSQKGYIRTVRGGNMSFRKTVLDQVGVFDTNFIGTAILEETDLSYRILSAGYKIMYEPNAGLLHLPQPSGNAATRDKLRAKWYRDYFHNGMLFLLKNKSLWELPFFFIAQLLIACKQGCLKEKNITEFFYMLGGLWDGYKTFASNSEK